MSCKWAMISRLAACMVLLACCAAGQIGTSERSFPDSAANIKKVLQQMQPAMAGQLPVLDGFAVSNSHPLNSYQRGYYQAAAQVSASAAGETVVRVTVKVTAWYSDPNGSHSGYQLLTSNGRIEADILDQLSEKLAALKPAPAGNVEASSPQKTLPAPEEDSLTSAPAPQTPAFPRSSPTLSPGQASQATASESAPPNSADPNESRLRDELQQLQEVLKNQAHPKNLVAVKKSGTPVVANPSLTAKPMFLASAHDEFEMLNFNQDWVHVRISGISRGWIWRNALEMPGDVPDTQAESATSGAADLFRVVREETAPFPGDWPPLRGKLVKLISVQKVDDNSNDAGPEMKLVYAKSLLHKSYAEILAQKSVSLSGVVLIFDSADGGMIAVPQPILAQWKAGELSDAALWHASFFDPPETFAPPSSASR